MQIFALVHPGSTILHPHAYVMCVSMYTATAVRTPGIQGMCFSSGFGGAPFVLVFCSSGWTFSPSELSCHRVCAQIDTVGLTATYLQGFRMKIQTKIQALKNKTFVSPYTEIIIRSIKAKYTFCVTFEMLQHLFHVWKNYYCLVVLGRKNWRSWCIVIITSPTDGGAPKWNRCCLAQQVRSWWWDTELFLAHKFTSLVHK